MAEAPSATSAQTPSSAAGPQSDALAAAAVVHLDQRVREVTVDTGVCTGTTAEFPPPTEAEAASLPFSLTYTVSGPAASAIAADAAQFPLATAGPVEGDLRILPNGALALDDPQLSAVEIGPGDATPIGTFAAGTGLRAFWQGYGGSDEPGLGAVVHEPGASYAVGILETGTFMVRIETDPMRAWLDKLDRERAAFLNASWMLHILPYIEQDNLLGSFRFDSEPSRPPTVHLDALQWPFRALDPQEFLRSLVIQGERPTEHGMEYLTFSFDVARVTSVEPGAVPGTHNVTLSFDSVDAFKTSKPAVPLPSGGPVSPSESPPPADRIPLAFNYFVSSAGTVRTHILSDALSGFKPTSSPEYQAMMAQFGEWMFNLLQQIDQGLADPGQVTALRGEIGDRVLMSLGATGLSDEEKERIVDQHLANVDMLVAIGKPAVSAVGPAVIEIRQEAPPSGAGATVTQEAPKATPPTHEAMTMWDKLCDAFWTLLAVLPSAWIGKILGKILGGIRGAIKAGQGAEAAKAAATAAKNAGKAARAAGATEAAARAEAAGARAAEAASNAERAAGEARSARQAADAAAREGRTVADDLNRNANALESQAAANDAAAKAAAEAAAKETEAAVAEATKGSSVVDVAKGIFGFLGEVTSIGAASRLGENLADAIDELTK